MSLHSTSLGVAAVALACMVLSAEDFQPLMKTTQLAWPEKRHVGVICDYPAHQAEIWALAAAAGEGARITVVDARNLAHADLAASLLATRKTDFVVLMPTDRFFGDGSFGATVAINRLASRGVPAIGTTPAALNQGAVFSLGDGTEGQILVTDRLIGTVHVVLPNRDLTSQKSTLVIRREGMATIAVHQAK